MGLFYDEPVKVSGKGVSRGQRPINIQPIPETGWELPKEFPNIFHAKRIGIDTETFDPELMTAGPGWGRNSGNLCGVSIAVEDDSWYFPLRHKIGENMPDTEAALRYLRDLLKNDRQVKVGGNLLYDIGWLLEDDIVVRGLVLDTFYAEALLDDWEKHVTLDYLGNKYVGEGKDEQLLYQWAADSYGGKPTRKQQAGNIYRVPPAIVGPYAEQDARLPLAIIDEQWKQLQREGLDDLFLMECSLTPLLLRMRKNGVRIDLDKAEQASLFLQAKEKEANEHIKHIVGKEINVYAATDLAYAFDKIGLKYKTTAKGAPSFTQGFLETVDHPLAHQVVAAKRYNKARSTFIENYIFNKHVNGRLHGSFHPLRGDDGGTVSGRFASSQPNLQNIPSRDKEIGPLIRGLFVPDHGDKEWIKVDYSQIEYRLFAHFSQSQSLISAYKDPNVDFHNTVSEILGGKLPRGLVKAFNFMLLYGGGKKKLTEMLRSSMDKEEAKELIKTL